MCSVYVWPLFVEMKFYLYFLMFPVCSSWNSRSSFSAVFSVWFKFLLYLFFHLLSFSEISTIKKLNCFKYTLRMLQCLYLFALNYKQFLFIWLTFMNCMNTIFCLIVTLITMSLCYIPPFKMFRNYFLYAGLLRLAVSLFWQEFYYPKYRVPIQF